MAHVTLYDLNERVDQIKKDLDKKVDKETIKLELELLQRDINTAQKEMARINSYGRWVIIVIATALITAILNLVIIK